MRFSRFLKKVTVIICAVTLAMQPISPFQVLAADTIVAVKENNVLTLGRTFTKNGALTLSYANSGIEVHFTGSALSANISADMAEGHFQNIAVFVDGKDEPEEAKTVKITGTGDYVLAEGLPYGEHVIAIRKMCRSFFANPFPVAETISINSLNLGDNGVLLTKPAKKKLSFEVYGDSITNGDALYLESDGSSAYSWASYVGEIARFFDADLKSCGNSGNGLLRSVLQSDGIYFNLFPPQDCWARTDSVATSEMYDHNANPADVVIINLGTNDNAAFLAGQISLNDFKNEYLRFMNEIHSDCPDAIIIGTLGAMGADGLKPAIQSAVNEANAQFGKTLAYYTELENCGNIRDGKAYDNAHPSKVAQRVYGEQLVEIIENALADNQKIDTSDYQRVNVVNAVGTSTDDATSRTAEKAVDGNYQTRWASSNYDGCNEWITLEFDGFYEVNAIKLLWETAFAKGYNIQTSLDGITWTDVKTFSYGNGYTEKKRLNGTKAKYLRINMLERGTYYSYSLWEIEVFGKRVNDIANFSKGKPVVGEMLMAESASPNAAMHLIDDSGMSGLEAPNHMCSSFDSNDSSSAAKIAANMYHSLEKSDIIIDYGKKECLGEMYIWNYNDLADTGDCMKEIKVSYSENGTDYTMLGTYILAQSNIWDDHIYGGNVACDIACLTDLSGDTASKHSIDFKGYTGRYVKITPVSNYGGDAYGLSEVRVFRHKTEPVSGESLTIDGFAPYQDSDESSINMFNNSGFSKIDSRSSDNETVSNDAKDMAVLSGGADKSLIILNLDGNYPLSKMKIWNFNNPYFLGGGMKDFDVYYTVDSPCRIITHSNEEINAGARDYIDFTQGSWRKLGSYTLNVGTGRDKMPASIEIDLNGIRAQHLKIVPKNNYYGNSEIFGLSEIKVYTAAGWATEYSREWSGMLSSSGEFAYQGNSVADSKGTSLNTSNNGRGWIGGDGLHITSLNGGQLQGSVNANSKNIFTFQDSFEGNFGNYDGFGLTQGYAQADNSGFSIGMRNMAYMYLTGDKPDVRNFKMYMQTDAGTYDNYPGYDGFNIYPGSYWLGDSTVVNNTLYTVANKFSGLSILGADFYASPISSSGFPSMNAIPQLLYSDIDNSRGCVYHETIYEEGDWLYVYGKKDNKLVVSRTNKYNYPTLSGFTYWTGSGWSGNSADAAYISDFMPGNEFNVTKITSGTFAGKYMLVHTDFSITGAVCYALADSPVGPFVRPADGQLYWSTEKYKLHMRYYKDSPVIFQQWNYNAKSQPSISKEGELLITYHFGIHDDQSGRVPAYGYFNAVGKEYEHPTFIKMFDVKEAVEEVKADIEGWQISTTNSGMRVVYSTTTSDKIIASGLVFGLDGYVSDSEMYVGSSNSKVHSYQANVGYYGRTANDNKNIYVMTLKNIKKAEYMTMKLKVRAYAKKNDGTYIYSDVYSASVFDIASYLYTYKKMSTQAEHEYLYNEILHFADENYLRIPYTY